MNYCNGKEVQNSVLCWKIVSFLEGPLLVVPLHFGWVEQFLLYVLPISMPYHSFFKPPSKQQQTNTSMGGGCSGAGPQLFFSGFKPYISHYTNTTALQVT